MIDSYIGVILKTKKKIVRDVLVKVYSVAKKVLIL